MSNKTITQFITISGLASGDELLIWDVSTSLTCKVAYSALAAGILDTPTIADFTNAQHNHQNAAGGGTIDHGAALNGLTDDDHTQYLLATGERTGASSQTQNFTVGISAGKIGIGTPTPSTMLHITGVNALALIERTGGSAALRIGTVGSTTDGGAIYAVAGDAGLRFMNFTASTDWMRIDASGNVGIGTTAPLRLLHLSAPSPELAISTTGSSSNAKSWRFRVSNSDGSWNLDAVNDAFSAASTAISIPRSGTTPSYVAFTPHIRVGYDTNQTSYFGRAAIGYNGASSDEATFAHIDYNSLNNIALTQTSNGSTILNAASGRVIQFQVNGSPTVTIDATDFYPSTDNARDCGTATNRWNDIYATNGTIQTSDERLKTDIVDSDLGLEFINSLRPVRYVWRSTPEKPRTRHHYGVIAQQTKAVLDELGIADFAGYIRDEKHDAYGLRYTEFIAPIIKAIQELNEEIATLRQQLSES